MAYNVLIVDDSETMRKVVRKTVAISGFDMGECWEARDGLEALEVLKKQWVDIILTDLNMPVMNGLIATAQIKSELPDTKVLIMSADGDHEMGLAALDCGADGFMPKASVRRCKFHLARLFPL